MHYAAGLKKDILRFAARYKMLDKGDKILVALSGGADSIALTLLLSSLSEELDISIAAAHLNHGLRGAESDRDEQFVRSFCDIRRIELVVGAEAVADIAAAEGSGIEETARRLRYKFLNAAAARCGCGKIATAHNACDNAETILFNLIRGAGVRGLSGIPPVRGNIIRPLLFAERKSIENYLTECGASFVQDSTNSDISYTRNKIRHKLMPLIAEINPSFAERALEASALLREDADFLDRLAEEYQLRGPEPPAIGCEDLLNAGNSLSGRVVRRMYRIAAEPAGRAELSKSHVDAVLQLASGSDPSGRVDLPGDITAKRRYDELIIERHREIRKENEPVMLSEGEVRFGGWRIKAELTDTEAADYTNDRNTVYIRSELLGDSLTVRAAVTGDKISPVSRDWTKTLKKLYIDLKIPRGERPERPVIVHNGAVCAIPGLRADKKFAAVSGPSLKITFSKDTII